MLRTGAFLLRRQRWILIIKVRADFMDKKSKKKWFGPTKIKRLFDICASFLALVVLSPLFLVICIVNLFTPECSVFFSHERRDGEASPLPFTSSRP